MLLGLVINAMQHGLIFVGLGMMPSANRPDEMKTISGPGPEAHNRVGSYIGLMAASFQVYSPGAPPKGDIEIPIKSLALSPPPSLAGEQPCRARRNRFFKRAAIRTTPRFY